jgi:hypothetical protein
MKNLIKISLVLFVIALLVLGLPGQVYAQGPTPSGDSPVVFGGDYVLPSGVQVEDLVVFGGNARLEAGSTITGDVVIFGGNLDANGTIRGNVVSFGGNLRLGETAVVEGNLNSLGGSSDISPQATVRGQRITGVGNMPLRIPSRVYTPGAWVDFGPGFNFLGAVFGALILAALAMLLTLLLPRPTERVAQTIGTQPVISGGVGLLTLIVAPALFVVLMITIILIPVGILGVLVFVLAILYGWIAIGLEVGKRIASLFKVTWPVPVSAGVGTLIFSLVTNLIFALTGTWFWALCCIGVPVLTLVVMMGLGGVITSRFGTEVYTNQRAAVPPAAPIFTPAQQPPVAPAAPVYPPVPQQPMYPPAPEYPTPPQPPAQSPFPQPPFPPEDLNQK